MALQFLSKGVSGRSGTPISEDVHVCVQARDSYSISFSASAIKKINGGVTVPMALKVAPTGNRIYFVPSNAESRQSFKVDKKNKSLSVRPSIRIGKKIFDLQKFEGIYNIKFDDGEQAYYIDRTELIR